MPWRREDYIPALRYDSLTFLYDPLMRWGLRESTFKQRLVEQAAIGKGYRVLDLGCGTATLTLLVKRLCGEATIAGLDGDLKILRIARGKASRAGLGVALHCGMSYELPYREDSFERVISSLFFHHVTRENKRRTLREVFRVLRPGGELHVADWGRPQNAPARAGFFLVQVLDGFETTADSVSGILPSLLHEAGFEQAQQTAQFWTVFGTLCLYCARKPRA